MQSTYEFWLLDDTGRRILLFSKLPYFSYSRSTMGFGTIQLGVALDDIKDILYPIFVPDRRVDVWRSPGYGYPPRREGIYLLLMYKIYTRETDNVQIVQYIGRDATDLLGRRTVIQAAGTSYTRKSDYLDDMMKEIVKEQMLWGHARDETGAIDYTRAYPQDEFKVEGDMSLGPLYSLSFAERNVMDVLRELKDASFQLNLQDATNHKVYFDVVAEDVILGGDNVFILDEQTNTPILDENGLELEDESSNSTVIQDNRMGLRFVTYAGMFGRNRTDGVEFSVENGNLEGPFYTVSHLEEVNSVVVKGFGRGDSRVTEFVQDSDRINVSRWNLREVHKDGSQEPDQDRLADVGYPTLYEGRPKEEINAVFLNVPDGPDNPRSLYGVDWDLGDLLPVSYAGKKFEVEVSIVYVAVDETGTETITGRNEITQGL